MPIVVVRSPDGKEREHEVSGEMSVGRGEDNDLVLVQGGVSRKHARIFLEDGKVMIEDAGSANGTFLNGEKIEGAGAIEGETQVVIGDYTLTLREAPVVQNAPLRPRPGTKRSGLALAGEGASPATRTLSRLPKDERALAEKPKAGPPVQTGNRAKRRAAGAALAPVPARGPYLKGLTGPWANKEYPVTALMVIGRVPGVDIQLDDDSVSRRHVEVEPRKDGLVLRDLGSANGTLVNGEPVSGEVSISSGDIIQVGVVELIFENGIGAPRRGARSAAPPARRNALLIGGLIAVGLGGASYGILRLASSPSSGFASPGLPSRVSHSGLDTAGQVQELLSQCRSYVSNDQSEPNWAKAEVACDKALDLDPLNTEGNELIRRIKFEQENFDHYTRAEKAMLRLHEEEALDEYSKIQNSVGLPSMYYLKAKTRFKDAAAAVMKKTSQECKEYAREGQTASALPRCEKYMTFACQDMTRDELVPPPGYTVRLSEGRLRKKEWRPNNPIYRTFLKVRQQHDPKAPLWECPKNATITTESTGPDIGKEVKESLDKRFPDKAMGNAIFDYWRGDPSQAVVQLLKIREDLHRSDEHQLADSLRKSIQELAALFKNGEGSLQMDDPLKAEEPFDEAFKLDKEIMKDLAEAKPSAIRVRMGKELAAACFKAGKFWNDRGDTLKACKIFKVGFARYRADMDLARSVLFCTGAANNAMGNASTCADFDHVLDLAVPGDGIFEKASAAKKTANCL